MSLGLNYSGSSKSFFHGPISRSLLLRPCSESCTHARQQKPQTEIENPRVRQEIYGSDRANPSTKTTACKQSRYKPCQAGRRHDGRTCKGESRGLTGGSKGRQGANGKGGIRVRAASCISSSSPYCSRPHTRLADAVRSEPIGYAPTIRSNQLRKHRGLVLQLE